MFLRVQIFLAHLIAFELFYKKALIARAFSFYLPRTFPFPPGSRGWLGPAKLDVERAMSKKAKMTAIQFFSDDDDEVFIMRFVLIDCSR